MIKNISIPKIVIRGILLLLVVMLLVSCVRYTTGVKPPVGLIYTDISAPLTINYDKTPVSGPSVVREWKSTKYFWAIISSYLTFAWDDASVRKIADSVGMDKVYSADYELTSILGVYAEFKITLYGSPKGSR